MNYTVSGKFIYEKEPSDDGIKRSEIEIIKVHLKQ